jgi:hypothetical protein
MTRIATETTAETIAAVIVESTELDYSAPPISDVPLGT